MLTSLPDEFRNFWNLRDDLCRARISTKVWHDILLAELDRPIIRGEIRQLIGKRVGPGVYEIRIEQEKETR